MVLGAFAAIGQTNIKRLMAYQCHCPIWALPVVVPLAAGNTGSRSRSGHLTCWIYLSDDFSAYSPSALAMRRREGDASKIDDPVGLLRSTNTDDGRR